MAADLPADSLRLEMSFTEEPSRVWEVGEPAPLEVPEPCHEPAVPELEPAGR